MGHWTYADPGVRLRCPGGVATVTIRIGIVDDHAVFRIGMRTALSRHPDVSVIWDRGTVSDCIAALRREPVDLLLLDVHLGAGHGPSGIEACSLILSRWPEVAVVLMTGLDHEGLADAARAAGAAKLIAKDASVESMLADILATARQRPPVRGEAIARRRTSAERAPKVSLSAREAEVLGLVGEGLTTREIARRLGISAATVNNHVQRLLRKLNARNRAHAAHLARSDPQLASSAGLTGDTPRKDSPE